jgi:hypothetical protein
MMNAALYGTVWASVALFVAGEAGKRRVRQRRGEPAWAWPLWAAGALLCVVHSAVTFAARYGWSHEAAVRATAAQTNTMFGLEWGGGIYVNYAFMAAWIGEAIWWRVDPSGYFARPAAVTAIFRVFYAVVLVNAAVIFAAPSRRVPGVLLMLALILIWFAPVRPAGEVRTGRR